MLIVYMRGIAARLSPGQQAGLRFRHACQCARKSGLRLRMIARGLLSNRVAAAVRTTSRCTALRNKTACTTHRTRPDVTSMMQSTSCLHHQACATWCFGRAAYVVPPSPCHRSLERRTDPRRAECTFRLHNPICNAQRHRSAAHCSSVSSTQQTSKAHKQNGAAPGFARRTSVKDVKVADSCQSARLVECSVAHVHKDQTCIGNMLFLCFSGWT